MGRAKDPSQWTPAYRQRMENAYAKNPFATKTEARRGANSKEAKAERIYNIEYEVKGRTEIKGDEVSGEWSQERTQGNIKAKLSNVKFREELGVISHKEADEARSKLKEMGQTIKDQYEKYAVGSRAYTKANDRIKELYLDLYTNGFIGDPGDDEWGEIYYH